MRSQLICMTALAVTLAGCKDKAQQYYENCVSWESTGDILGATGSCETAVREDPDTKYGKLAAAKLEDLRPKADKIKAESEAKLEAERARLETERRAREEANRQAREAQRGAALKEARQKVTMKFDGTERDGQCAGAGKPPYRATAEGGTYAENELVARERGCERLYANHTDDILANEFCCARGPRLSPFD